MKRSSALCLLLAASSASAHYTFPDLIFGGKTSSDYQYVKLTANHYSNGPVTDVTSDAMRCYADPSNPVTSTASVSAGDTVGFAVSPDVYHPGPLMFYMAKVPSGQTAASFDGSGTVWFKIYENQATITSSSISWPEGMATVSVQIPSCIPAGQYLLRVEHVALHSASTVGGAQLYIACGQLNVSGGGSTAGSPLVAFPGAYSATDPSILINIYNPVPQSYTPPGPAVFSCSGGNGGGNTGGSKPTTTAKTSAAPTTTPPAQQTTTKVTTTVSKTTTASGAGQTLYGQCGGSGWTGPTTCASGTCKALNSYYSQCS